MSADPRRILQCAEEFRRAGIKLEGDARIGEHMTDLHVLNPMAVCFAFAFEIYLKFLIKKTTATEPPFTHNLRELFDLLPADISDKIKQKWENPHPNMAAQRAEFAKRLGKNHPGFDEILNRESNIFQKLRYPYHYEGGDWTWLGADIMECTRRVIYELFPNEFSDIRLALPPGSLSQAMQNKVIHQIIDPKNKKKKG